MNRTMRILSLVFALIMVLSLIPVAALAEEEVEPAPAEPFVATLSAVCYTASDRKTLVGTADTRS